MSKSTQAGAALVESVIILSGLIGLLALLPQLAKLQALRQSAVEAGRYTSWQLSVGEQPSRESVAARFFIQPDADLTSENSSVDFLVTERSISPRVRRHAFDPISQESENELPSLGSGMINLNTLTVHAENNAEHPGTLVESGVNTIRRVSNWLGNSDAIASGQGIVKHTLAFATHGPTPMASSNADCSENSIFCFSAESALLIDGWEAADNHETEHAAAVLVPTTLLKPLGATLAKVSAVPLLKEFSKMGAGFGCVNTTALPTKELSGEIVTEKNESGESDRAC